MWAAEVYANCIDCFSVATADIKSLDFAVTRFLMKLFRTTNIDV